jgi:threonine/homoserine/homoserine lactone efflux protein
MVASRRRLVMISDPKIRHPKSPLVFGAFIAHFVDPRRDRVWQIAVLGATFRAAATLCSSARPHGLR